MQINYVRQCAQTQLATVVGDYINKTKITFDLNFYLYKAVKQHECK